MNYKNCSGCKVKKSECYDGCILAPYFPLTKLESFERLHRIFGADTVFRILDTLKEDSQREAAVNALCYEAEARERDPIFGYVGMFYFYQNQLKILEKQINSAKIKLARIVGSDNVPQYSNFPMLEDFLTTKSSLQYYIEKMDGLNEVQKNELMQQPATYAQEIVNEIFKKREYEKMCDGHGDAGASTSAGPSMAFGSSSATHKKLPLPPNQNQI